LLFFISFFFLVVVLDHGNQAAFTLIITLLIHPCVFCKKGWCLFPWCPLGTLEKKSTCVNQVFFLLHQLPFCFNFQNQNHVSWIEREQHSHCSSKCYIYRMHYAKCRPSVRLLKGCTNCWFVKLWSKFKIKNEFLIDAEGGPFNPTFDSNQGCNFLNRSLAESSLSITL
jgi:hypothetical protein